MTAAMKIKDACSLEESYDQLRKHIKKHRHYFANKGASIQGYVFSISHVWMWELDYKDSWMPKNWSFWTVVLVKTLESPLDCKEIQPVHPKGNQSWIFTGSTHAEAETPLLWSPYVKKRFIGKDSDTGKDWRWAEKETTEDEMLGRHHQLKDLSLSKLWELFTGKPGVLSPWGHKESDMLNNWTELRCISGTLLLFPWSNRCWQFDLWSLCLF